MRVLAAILHHTIRRGGAWVRATVGCTVVHPVPSLYRCTDGYKYINCECILSPASSLSLPGHQLADDDPPPDSRGGDERG